MANPRFAWGIDVGNRALKAVKVVRTPEGLRVDDFELIEHETVLSNAGDNREALIQSALANFVQRHPMKGGVVAVGVSGQSSFARFIKLPPVEPKKIPEIVRFEAIQQIPFPLDDVEWSYQLFQSPDSPEVEVGIFAMRKELINRFIKDFTDFDLNVQVVQTNPLAVYNAMYQDNRFTGTTMVIDMGAENTDLILADNDTIWMRSIPIGGNNFTQTLEKAFKLPFAKAEELKRNAATSKYARQIFQAMRPIFADLVAEIQRSVGFYASVHRDSRIKNVIALGGTFRLPGLQKYLQQNLQLDVDGVDSLGVAGPPDAKIAAHFNENLRASVAAYGMAVQAMGEGKVTSNLLPTAIRRAKLWKGKTKWFATAAALFVVGTLVAGLRYAIQNLEYKQGEQARAQILSITTEANGKDAAWQEIEDFGANDRQQILNVRALTQYRTLWRDMLLDLQNAIPQPQKEVADGLAQQNPDLVKKIPRGQRNVIFIDSIASQFYGDLNSVLLDPDFKRFAVENIASSTGYGTEVSQPGMAPAAPDDTSAVPAVPVVPNAPVGGVGAGAVLERGGAGTRGFVVTVKCTSPNQDAIVLVNDQLVANLMAIWPSAQRPTMEYGVAKAIMAKADQIEHDPNRMQKLKLEFDSAVQAKKLADAAAATIKNAAIIAAGGTPPVAPGGSPANPNIFGADANPDPNAAAAPVETDAYNDRLTGEDMRKDWEFTVVFAVRLDPPKAPATPPTPAAPAGPAAAVPSAAASPQAAATP